MSRYIKICLKCTTDTLHEDLCTYSFDNSALWVLELRQTLFSAGYLRAEAEDTFDDITIRRDRSLGLPM